MGLRKFLLAGIGPLGCIPNQRASGLSPPDRCVDQVNQIVGYFNAELKSLVQQLNANHPGSFFIYGNTYRGIGDMLNNPSQYGMHVSVRRFNFDEGIYERRKYYYLNRSVSFVWQVLQWLIKAVVDWERITGRSPACHWLSLARRGSSMSSGMPTTRRRQ